MRFLYVILDILEPLKIITKMAESQSVTMPYLRKVIDEQIVILESLKTHPGSNERNFENLIVTVEAPNPMQPFRSSAVTYFHLLKHFYLLRKILMLQSKFMTTL